MLYWHIPKLSQQLYTGTHHITLLSEDTIPSTLWGHPSYRKLHVSITLLPAVVVSTVDIFSQTKICHFYHPIGINPIGSTLCAVCGSLNLEQSSLGQRCVGSDIHKNLIQA